MRILLLFTFSVFTNWICSQGDYQWMIFNNEYKVGASYPTTSSYPIASTIYIDSIMKPNRDVHIKASNDFFAIFDNGEYYLSNRNELNTDVLNVNSSALAPIIGYELNFTEPINYLYMTNRYEDDDPKDRVVVSGSSTITTNETPNLGFFNRSYNKLTHQTPMIGSDIVFIIDKDYIQEKCGTMTLCYQDELNNITFSPVTFSNNSNLVSNYNLIYKDGVSFNTASVSFGRNKCLDVPNVYGRNMFIKFRVNGSTEETREEEIIYTLTQSGPGCDTISSQDSVLPGHHDPNFVELKCVWEENGEYYGLYHIECFNDGDGAVDSLKMTTPLPSFIDTGSIKILNWAAKCKNGCGTKCKDDIKIVVKTNDSLKVKFPVGLDKYVSSRDSLVRCNYTAYFEFSAKIIIPLGESIHTYNLSLGTPNTNFNTSMYNITTFIEQKSCLPDSIANPILDTMAIYNIKYNMDLKCMLGRTLNNCSNDCKTNLCELPPKCPWWNYLIAGLILVILLYFIKKMKKD